MCVLSRVQFFATPQTAVRQAHLSMGSPRLEYCNGFPTVGDPPHPGVKPKNPTLQGDSLPLSRLGSPGEPHFMARTAQSCPARTQAHRPNQEVNERSPPVLPGSGAHRRPPVVSVPLVRLTPASWAKQVKLIHARLPGPGAARAEWALCEKAGILLV